MTVIRFQPSPPYGDDLVDCEAFRHAFRQLATTVGILTYIDLDGRPRGMTATSLCALSADPPSMLVCVDRATRTHDALEHQTSFGVSLLSDRQTEIAVHCSQPGADKSLRDEWLAPARSLGDVPRVLGAVAHFECRLERIEPAFTHSIVIGLIRETVLDPSAGEPLLYHDRRFRNLAD